MVEVSEGERDSVRDEGEKEMNEWEWKRGSERREKERE